MLAAIITYIYALVQANYITTKAILRYEVKEKRQSVYLLSVP